MFYVITLKLKCKQFLTRSGCFSLGSLICVGTVCTKKLLGSSWLKKFNDKLSCLKTPHTTPTTRPHKTIYMFSLILLKDMKSKGKSLIYIYIYIYIKKIISL